jgi:cysteine synthase
VDEVVPVSGDEALRLARELASREGIFAGTSSGATLDAALQVARRAPAGSNIVCMLPDTGERYLSTPLFYGVSEEMTDAEIELSRSTPNYRFDVAPVPAPAPAASVPAAADPDAERMVDDIIAQQPVVMFALQWCEFCWSVRKLFAQLGVEYHSVDLDSVAYQADDRGGRIRRVLAHRTGAATIPQIYISGVHVGGCTELFDACRDGTMLRLLQEAGVTCDANMDFDPYALLPQWLQPRKSA